MSASDARKRARELFIASHGQADYDDIKMALKLEGLGDHETGTLRQWRSRDIKAGYVKPANLAKKFEQISKSASRVVEKLGIPDKLSIQDKVECARLADLEDTHERMLRVTNACAERLEQAIPNITIDDVGDLSTIKEIAVAIADSGIRLRQALINVREQTMKVIGTSDGKALQAEVLPPETKPPVAGLTGALAAFRQAG